MNDEAARQGRSDNADLSPQSSDQGGVKRLRGYLFVVIRRDGTREDAIFYALTAREATKYARSWAQRRGHCRVELQDEENAA